jgi:hypothetical protein
MFDSKQMIELQHIARDRYQRAGGGGAHVVYNSSKAFHDSRGHKDMSKWNRAVYEALVRWRQAAEYAKMDYRWDCHAPTLDLPDADIPF